MKYTYRRGISMLLLFVFLFLLSGCAFRGATELSPDEASDSIPETMPEDPDNPEKEIWETETVSVLGIFADDSYDADNGNALVWLCYAIIPQRSAVSFDCRSASIRFDDADAWPSVRQNGACDYMPSFYYSDYLTEATPGQVICAAETFPVPAGELEKGRTITFEKPAVPDFARLRLSTSDITHCDGSIQVAQIADPDGYAEESGRRAKPDETLAAQIRKRVNGRTWMVHTADTWYKVAFAAPDTFALISGPTEESILLDINTATVAQLDNAGTYEVTNSYLICTFPESNGHAPLVIPYSHFGDGEDENGVPNIELDVYAALDEYNL